MTPEKFRHRYRQTKVFKQIFTRNGVQSILSDINDETFKKHYDLAIPGVPFHYGDVVCQHSSSSPSIIVRNFFTNHLSLCVITLHSRYDAPTSPTHKSLLQVHRIGNESLLQVPHTSPPKWHRVPLTSQVLFGTSITGGTSVCVTLTCRPWSCTAPVSTCTAITSWGPTRASTRSNGTRISPSSSASSKRIPTRSTATPCPASTST